MNRNPFLANVSSLTSQNLLGDTSGPNINTSSPTQILDIKNISGLDMTRCFITFRGRYKLPIHHPISIILSEMSCVYFPQNKYRNKISCDMLIEILNDIQQKVCKKNIKLSPNIDTNQYIYTLNVEEIIRFHTDFAYILGQISSHLQGEYCQHFHINHSTLRVLHKKYSQILLST